MRRQTLEFLDAFDENFPKYDLWTKKLELLVKEILDSNGLMFHSVSGRTKDRASLAKKIECKRRGHYKVLGDITDLSGIRVITYFSDDVDRVADALSKEFEIDKNASVDKRNQLGTDAFGYMSMHFIVSLGEERCKLAEYKRLHGVKAEIQIRSVLQHAWAEIEHDLGYKSEGAIPRPLRRRFSRLASLLELGDDEFVTIRDQLSNYQQTVTRELVNSPQTVEIDKVSLISFMRSDYMESLDKDISCATDYRISPTKADSSYTSQLELVAESSLRRLAFLGIKTIGELESDINKLRAQIPIFAANWLSVLGRKISDSSSENEDDDEIDDSTDRRFPPGIGLFYFSLLNVIKSNDKNRYLRYWMDVAQYDEEDAKRNVDFMVAVQE